MYNGVGKVSGTLNTTCLIDGYFGDVKRLERWGAKYKPKHGSFEIKTYIALLKKQE
jgi:hypothetical protein